MEEVQTQSGVKTVFCLLVLCLSEASGSKEDSLCDCCVAVTDVTLEQLSELCRLWIPLLNRDMR